MTQIANNMKNKSGGGNKILINEENTMKEDFKVAADMDPLNIEEIDIARQRIDEMHPLKRSNIEKILPGLCCFIKYCRKSNSGLQNNAEEDELAEIVEDVEAVDDVLSAVIENAGGEKYEGTDAVEDSKKIYGELKKHDELSHDIFKDYGFGILTYFNLM